LPVTQEDYRRPDDHGFSLASDIVELVVLTTDEVFLRTLREAVGGARRLWHVPSADKVSDLLIAGQVGILVLDVHALPEGAGGFIEQIKRQFPDLVLVAAGNRDAETSLAGSISAGTVYRFIHKPMSPGRARLFAEAAVKKHVEKRRRTSVAPIAPQAWFRDQRLLIGGTVGVVCLLIATWALHKAPRGPADSVPDTGRRPIEAPAQAAARSADDDANHATPAQARERLLGRAENALLEERLDEAAAAIEAARKSGVDNTRLAFLSAQLAKSRARLKGAQAQAHGKPDVPAATDPVAPLLALTRQRADDRLLIEPDGDSARFYLLEALQLDPANDAVQAARESLALRLLAEARAAIERGDFARATAWLAGASGIAVDANIESVQQQLRGARAQADADARDALLKTANERLRQDRLIEPDNDSALYYLATLRGLDPAHAGLAAATEELGGRLSAKARRALGVGQYDAARGWLDAAASTGYASPEAAGVRQELSAALSHQAFMANVVPAGSLQSVKSVQPAYPSKAQLAKIEGWVELDFTVAENGAVKDIAIRGASNPGVFDVAATRALSQWTYQPVIREGRAAAQRARIRIRFSLRP
jgi:TonB family protein